MTIPELYENIGGSYESVKRILPMDRLIGKFVLKFLDEKSCSKLLAAKDANDPVGMFEGAHAMKGVCANLGLDDLSHMASDIAEEFRPGHTPAMSPDELDRRFAELKALYDRTITGIQQFAAEQ